MGFGSYDETEQENNEVDISQETEGAETLNRNEDGNVQFEGMDSETMLDQFEEIN